MLNIFLVRHGQSEGDVNHKIRSTMPDNKIKLTQRGIEQAKLSAKEFINRSLHTNPIILTSPFERTRRTSEIFFEEIKDREKNLKIKENVLLAEQQFGLYNGLTGEEIKNFYPKEHDWHQKYIENESRFFSPIPMGESRFQVALRARMFLDDLKNYWNNDSVIIVSHATFIRALIMMIFNYSPEWFDNEPKPNNCSIIQILNPISNPELHFMKANPILFNIFEGFTS